MIMHCHYCSTPCVGDDHCFACGMYTCDNHSCPCLAEFQARWPASQQSDGTTGLLAFVVWLPALSGIAYGLWYLLH